VTVLKFCRDAARRAGLSATAEQLVFVINMTAVDFKLALNILMYSDSDYISLLRKMKLTFKNKKTQKHVSIEKKT